jgi:hypothetical protein
MKVESEKSDPPSFEAQSEAFGGKEAEGIELVEGNDPLLFEEGDRIQAEWEALSRSYIVELSNLEAANEQEERAEVLGDYLEARKSFFRIHPLYESAFFSQTLAQIDEETSPFRKILKRLEYESGVANFKKMLIKWRRRYAKRFGIKDSMELPSEEKAAFLREIMNSFTPIEKSNHFLLGVSKGWGNCQTRAYLTMAIARDLFPEADIHTNYFLKDWNPVIGKLAGVSVDEITPEIYQYCLNFYQLDPAGHVNFSVSFIDDAEEKWHQIDTSSTAPLLPLHPIIPEAMIAFTRQMELGKYELMNWRKWYKLGLKGVAQEVIGQTFYKARHIAPKSSQIERYTLEMRLAPPQSLLGRVKSLLAMTPTIATVPSLLYLLYILSASYESFSNGSQNIKSPPSAQISIELSPTIEETPVDEIPVAEFTISYQQMVELNLIPIPEEEVDPVEALEIDEEKTMVRDRPHPQLPHDVQEQLLEMTSLSVQTCEGSDSDGEILDGFGDPYLVCDSIVDRRPLRPHEKELLTVSYASSNIVIHRYDIEDPSSKNTRFIYSLFDFDEESMRWVYDELGYDGEPKLDSEAFELLAPFIKESLEWRNADPHDADVFFSSQDFHPTDERYFLKMIAEWGEHGPTRNDSDDYNSSEDLEGGYQEATSLSKRLLVAIESGDVKNEDIQISVSPNGHDIWIWWNGERYMSIKGGDFNFMNHYHPRDYDIFGLLSGLNQTHAENEGSENKFPKASR